MKVWVEESFFPWARSPSLHILSGTHGHVLPTGKLRLNHSLVLLHLRLGCLVEILGLAIVLILTASLRGRPLVVMRHRVLSLFLHV